MDELTKDMCNLTKAIWELSKKHGGIHINSACVGAEGEGNHSDATVKLNNEYISVEYWGNTKQFTKNVTEKIK
jgi:hypothetical protein